MVPNAEKGGGLVESRSAIFHASRSCSVIRHGSIRNLCASKRYASQEGALCIHIETKITSVQMNHTVTTVDERGERVVILGGAAQEMYVLGMNITDAVEKV